MNGPMNGPVDQMDVPFGWSVDADPHGSRGGGDAGPRAVDARGEHDGVDGAWMRARHDWVSRRRLQVNHRIAMHRIASVDLETAPREWWGAILLDFFITFPIFL